ncbi:MAG: ATP-binding protein [Actinomycetota bacterium]
MSTFRKLPGSARWGIVGFVAMAAGALAIRMPDISTWTWQDLGVAVGLGLTAALSEQFTVAVSHRTETENFSVTDAVWVPALLLAPASVLTLSVLLGTLAGHAFRRWAWYKVVFNASQFVVAITVAEFVYQLLEHAFGLSGSFSLLTWVACAVAMSCYFVLNELSVALIISRVEGISLRKVVLLPGGLNLLHAAGNLTVGMLAALVWDTGLVGLPLLIAPIVLSFFAYRGWLQTKRQEEQRREGERMRTLYEAGRALFGPLDARYDFKPFLELVRRLVDATGAELAMRDGSELRVYSSESGLCLAVPSVEGHADPGEYVNSRPGLSTYLTVVGDEKAEVGVLAVYRKADLSAPERILVDALASQVSVRQQNQQLFHETVEQRGHLADVVGSSSDGIFVLSAAGTVLSWNPAMERITGFRADEVVGHRFDEVVRVLREPDADGASESHFVVGAPELQDALIVRRDGSVRWIRYASSRMPDRAGEGSSHVVTARDVTAELEAEQMKSDFVATVSHELRSPLTPLKGLLQSLDEGLIEDSPEARREYYQIMLRQANRLERLINDLLDVSRIETGSLAMDTGPVEVGAVLEHEIREASHLPGARPVRLERPDHSVWATADGFRLGQIISNLLSNAFKYTSADAPVVVRLEKLDERVVVSVQDAGEGIPLAEQDRVFQRFYRTDGVMRQKPGGFGLGLYIARRIAEAMGGQLVLTSSPGQGCLFSVSLPHSDVGSREERSADLERV